MPAKYSFGGLGNLFKCECGCSEFYLAEDVKPERLKVYECVNCHEWWVVSAQQNAHPTLGESAPFTGSCQH